MKNLLITQLFTFIFSILLFNIATAQTEYRIDSIQQYNLDTSSMILTMELRTHNTFDNNGTKETNQLALSKENSAWNNLTNHINTYNINNNIILKRIQSWDPDTSLWMNSSKIEYIYDAAQNNTLMTNSMTIDNGASWFIISKSEMEYNASNQMTVNTLSILDFISNTLLKNTKYLYTYSGMRLTETNIQQWNTANSQWKNYEKDVASYTGNLETQEDRYHYTNNTLDAIPFERSILTYNGSDQLFTLKTLVNVGGALVNSELATNTYLSNRLSQTIIQTWNAGTTLWDNTDRTTYGYDSNSNLTDFNSYDWSAADWRNIFRLRQYWSVAIPFSLGIAEQDLSVIKAFPNPFHDLLEIKLKSPLDSEAQIQVYDIYGKAITSTYLLEGQDHITLNLNTVSSGMYLINFNSLDQHKTFKILKQ